MSDQFITRLAPTPSGFLHLGNIFNFLYIFLLAKKNNGLIKLRIDDIDKDRFREEYLEDIFQTLDWLDINYDIGPFSVEEFKKSFSQLKKIEHYRSFLKRIDNKYFCECSRSSIKKVSKDMIYPGVCRDKNIKDGLGEFNIRIKIARETSLTLGSTTCDLSKDIGDFVLWRKDDTPSYQLVSLIEDASDKVTSIIRGVDLLNSTFMQTCISNCLEFDTRYVSYFHHRLLKESGKKLSKSVLSNRKNSLKGEISKEKIYLLFLDWIGLNNSYENITMDNLLEISNEKINEVSFNKVQLK